MIPDWAQFLIYLAALFGVFVWLRNDIRSFRDESRDERKQLRDDMQGEMKQLREGLQGEMKQLRDDIRLDIHRVERKVDDLDNRLRAVESEQSRVAGLLEGLGLAGALPGDER